MKKEINTCNLCKKRDKCKQLCSDMIEKLKNKKNNNDMYSDTTVNVYNSFDLSNIVYTYGLSKIEEIPFKIILFSQNMRGVKAKEDFPFSYLHFYLPNRPFFKKLSNILHLKSLFCKYDLLHIPSNTDDVENEKKVIYTIHDLAVCRYPQMWGVENNPLFYQQLRASLHNCKAIITCSECSKQDIIAFAHIPQEKITSFILFFCFM